MSFFSLTGDLMESTRILLEAHEIPTHWYNIAADLPTPPAPPLLPDGSPARPEQLGAIFPPTIIEQEMSSPVIEWTRPCRGV